MTNPIDSATALELSQLRAQVATLQRDLQLAEVRNGSMIGSTNQLRRERDNLRGELERATAQHKTEVDRMLQDVADARLRVEQATIDATVAAQKAADAGREITSLKVQVADLYATKSRLAHVEPAWQMYQDAVDYLFHNTQEQQALLPNFMRLGGLKSEALIKLGREYQRAVFALTAAGFSDTPTGWQEPDRTAETDARSKKYAELHERATKAENALARIRAITLGGA